MPISYPQSQSDNAASQADRQAPQPAGISSFPLPELLAPAGDWECARAAIENGADAIYFGLERHNARLRANNFTLAELPRLMEYLHRRGARGYVTFNTLVFAEELAEAGQTLHAIMAAGADAVVVQDVGLVRLIRQISPDFPIHASTQMTITSLAGVEFAREAGCTLAVLARECSLKEIAQVQAGGNPGAPPPAPRLPMQVFVHGALCVAFSGQCLTSEALGGRSANRGECAQACRLPYDLIVDGQLRSQGGQRYVLSPQDLAGLGLLPELVRLGIHSLKIEGRLKSAEYVANITRIYRRALDQIAQASRSGPVSSSGVRPSSPEPGPGPGLRAEAGEGADQSRYEMEMAFSRGLSTGWLRGINHQQLVHARFGKKRGVYLGEVRRLQGEQVLLELEGPLKSGDGVVFDAGRPEEPEEGGRVYEVRPLRSEGKSPASKRRAVALSFGRGDINFHRVHVGDKVWKTSDPALERQLRQSYAGAQPYFQRPLHFEVIGRVGQPLRLRVRDEQGRRVEAVSSLPLAEAEKQPLTTARLREQLGRLGGTPFLLGDVHNAVVGALMLPLSELNRLRREIVAQLEALRAQPPRWTINETGPLEVPGGAGIGRPIPPPPALPPAPEMVVLVRTLPQLDAALRCGITTLYCDFEDLKKYREAVTRCRQYQPEAPPQSPAPQLQRATIFVAPPRIFKTGEEGVLTQMRSGQADGYLVRNYDHLKFFAGCRCVGDYSFNVANPLAAEYFIRRYGLERVTASYDLNAAQLETLLQSAPPHWFEITLHQRIPMFHMEYCVFCKFLSSGTDYTNCGRVCERHEVQLRDRVGAAHPLKADAGCRNTVFHALVQTGAESAGRLMGVGARRFRIEFLDETPAQVGQTLGQYRRLLRGEITGGQLWRELKLVSQLGVTRGQMLKASGRVDWG